MVVVPWVAGLHPPCAVLRILAFGTWVEEHPSIGEAVHHRELVHVAAPWVVHNTPLVDAFPWAWEDRYLDVGEAAEDLLLVVAIERY